MKCAMSDTGSQERIDKLRSISLFTDCSDASLEKILDVATEFEAERGHVLAQPNQPGAGLFVVEEGSVVVELPGHKIELGAGEFFGELALLDEQAAHTARVSAAEHVKALAIARDDFEKLLHDEPAMAVSMLKVLARRLAGTTKS
jgi:voltage-gated potassium channel